eukprot:4189991-Alexandrium_andersonii.AAC.1
MPKQRAQAKAKEPAAAATPAAVELATAKGWPKVPGLAAAAAEPGDAGMQARARFVYGDRGVDTP